MVISDRWDGEQRIERRAMEVLKEVMEEKEKRYILANSLVSSLQDKANEMMHLLRSGEIMWGIK